MNLNKHIITIIIISDTYVILNHLKLQASAMNIINIV